MLPTIANVTALAAGDYFVTAKVGICSSPATKTTVVVNPLPVKPTITAPAEVLSHTSGYTASITPVSGGVYTWTITNGTITAGADTASITFTSGGTGPIVLTVTVRNTSGCTSDVATASIAVLPVGYYTVTPCRVVSRATIGAGQRILPLVEGACGIPTTAKAIALNMTVVDSTEDGYLTIYPGDLPGVPGTSTLNFRAGVIRANNAIVSIGGDGTVGIFNSSIRSVTVIVDVNGFFQ